MSPIGFASLDALIDTAVPAASPAAETSNALPVISGSAATSVTSGPVPVAGVCKSSSQPSSVVEERTCDSFSRNVMKLSVRAPWSIIRMSSRPAPVPPPAPGTFPSGYDPARLGTSYLAGNSWQGIVTAGTTDNGYANLVKVVGFAMGSSATPTNATKNASEQIDLLTLQANRTRQAGITRELLDIVGGAEALRG